MDFAVAFALGIVGSIHCAQMCGPLVVSYTLPLVGTPKRTQLAGHLAYNAGRLTTYAALGAAAGTLGGAVAFVGRLAGVAQLASIVGGALLLVAAATLAGLFPGERLVAVGVFRPASALSRTVVALMNSSRPSAKAAMGMLLGFLPCGLVYAALARAGSTASPIAGAAIMAAFGAGTTVALLAVGLCSTWIGRWAAARGTRLAAAAIAAMGIVLLVRAFGGGAAAMHAAHAMHDLGTP